MKTIITLDSNDIEKAVLAFLASKGVDLIGKTADCAFIAQRSPAGVTGTITLNEGKPDFIKESIAASQNAKVEAKKQVKPKFKQANEPAKGLERVGFEEEKASDEPADSEEPSKFYTYEDPTADLFGTNSEVNVRADAVTQDARTALAEMSDANSEIAITEATKTEVAEEPKAETKSLFKT
jgi:hypothetical protein